MATRETPLRTPKGTRDWVGADLLLRDEIIQKITTILSRHNALPLSTPAFELRSTLTSKYGGDAPQLIYDLAPDQQAGGSNDSQCALRYDLTVPFARWLASRTDIKRVRRSQVGRVFRRDQPAIARGRLREFTQVDFDIAGVYDAMVPDAEVLCVVAEVFEVLGMGVVVKVNNRKVLDGVFEAAGVPEEKVRGVSSAVDKLDKVAWEEVRREMVEKGVEGEVADRVGMFVKRSGGLREMVDELAKDGELGKNERVAEGLEEMALLASYLEAADVVDKVSFDLSLARGLDYYTGVIYEVVPDASEPPSQVGSIAAGGRYDNLVGMYGRRSLPCVGVSFGIDRIFTLLDARREIKGNPKLESRADVFIMAFGGKEFDGLLLERMRVARQLWRADIRADFVPAVKPKPMQQFNASEGVPVAVILGQDELAAGQVRVKRLQAQEGGPVVKDKGRLVPRENVVEEVKRLLASPAVT